MRRIPHALPLAVLSLLVAFVAPPPTQGQQNPCVMVNLHPNQAALAGATIGQPYSQNTWVTPASPCIPTIWSVSGSLPLGLNLVPVNDTLATLSGVPTATGSSTFTVTAQCTYICGTVCFLSRTYTLVVS